ncbi:LuxR C-terminal-related transcriptional regulator [Cohnella panacarvi]|uniref:LuxR C-terminal-related transcriptional regulator n=1 Tax=Cohnella panacarvi TaxID=400776 RepID=UPI0004AE4B25|nr:LuxR C-terminal-related transcriptional regulator [Cohnella panacarvi]
MNLLKKEAYRSLIALVAPMGYGKTTILGAWANALSPSHTIGWLTLDSGDNDVHRFLSSVILSLPLDKATKSNLLEQLRIERNAPSLLPLIESIANQLNARGEVHLFLDNYEAIREEAVHRVMELLIALSLKHVHLYIASREKLPFYSNIRHLHPGPLTLSRDHLKLSGAEIKQYVKHAAKIQLPNDETMRLEQITEGWFPALTIYSSYLDGSRATTFGEPYPPVDALQSELHERFLNDIFNLLPPDLQQFMLQTSIPDFFHADFSLALTDNPRNNIYIERLVRQNLFLFQESNGQYRYHGLFLRFLRAHCIEMDQDRFMLLHARSISWFEQQGMVLEAVRHALRIAAYDRASELLLADMATTFSYPMQSLIELMERFPDPEIYRRPSIAMLYAWCLTAEHRITAAETVLHKTEAYMTDEQYPFPPTGEDLRGYLASIYSRIYFLRRDTEKGMAYMRETGQRLNGPGYLYSHINTLNPSGSSLLRSDVGHWGAIDQSIAMCEEGKAGWKGINQGYGIMESLLGECLYERNQLIEAEKFLLNGRKIGLDLMDPGLLLPTSLTLAQLKQDIGEQQAAQSLLEETGKLLSKHTPNALPVVHACQARLDMKSGNWAQAKRWLRTQPFATDGEPDKRHMYGYLTILRAYIHLRQYGQGIRLGEKLLQFCTNMYLQYYIAEIQMLLAILYEKNGDTGTALRKIGHALEIGREEGYVRLFLNEWDLAESAVRRYGKMEQLSPAGRSYVEQLIRPGIESEPSNDKTSLARNKLSSKEYEVLQLLIQGQSNAMIAKNLSITIETVKTHCKHIYFKLHLKSRKEVQRHFN